VSEEVPTEFSSSPEGPSAKLPPKRQVLRIREVEIAIDPSYIEEIFALGAIKRRRIRNRRRSQDLASVLIAPSAKISSI